MEGLTTGLVIICANLPCESVHNQFKDYKHKTFHTYYHNFEAYSRVSLECILFGHKTLKMFTKSTRARTEIWLRLCLSRNMEFPALVLRNFGPFVPGITSSGGAAGEEGEGVRSNRAGCGQLLCTKKCLAAADIYWPQVSSIKPQFTFIPFKSFLVLRFRESRGRPITRGNLARRPWLKTILSSHSPLLSKQEPLVKVISQISPQVCRLFYPITHKRKVHYICSMIPFLSLSLSLGRSWPAASCTS